MKRIFFGIVCLLTNISLFANIGPQGFAQFHNDYFIETGSYNGEGIFKALRAGFKEVRTIEANADFVKHCKQRFSNYNNVKVLHGDSAVILYDVIKDITQPITFWLDAHIYPPVNDRQNCPLIEELDQIKRHPIKTHTILIDDMHCLNTQAFDYLSRDDITRKILEINPNYRIWYVDGGDDGSYKNNVMVATIP